MAAAGLAPLEAHPSADRVPVELANGTPEPLRSELRSLLGPEQVLSRVSDLVRYASDASPYRMLPKVVVRARDAADIATVLAYGRRKGIPVTFRAGATSLNGQAQSTGIMVDARRGFAGIEVLEDGARVRVRPGSVLGHVNAVLRPHGYRMGPDPASTAAATVGGVIANNSGGMRCGTTEDSYSLLDSLTFTLPSGTMIDTATPGAAERFAAEEPELAAGLAAIREEILADPELSARIRHKFEIKNTTGYRLCAFLDAPEPLEIFRRLLVGSEGTLGFISEAVFRTVPTTPRTTVALVHFDSIAAAAEPVPELVAAGASAVELMVAASLIAASYSIPGTPESWRELPAESALLLVELGGADEEELAQREAAAIEILGGRELIRELGFHRDHETIELYWTVREGMHGLIGRIRQPGTVQIVEDVVVPPARIAEAAEELREMLTRHGFLPGVAGHASAGNLHFFLTPDLSKPEDVDRYEAFIAELVELIVGKYDGSLKGEHGTGINMAPFVEREWGPKATELMWRIKRLADPEGVLAPGVILSEDPAAHLSGFMTIPPVEEAITRCVECGMCEPVCPSRGLTTTPRERIALRREMVRQPPGSPVLAALIDEYEYDGVETCAADGTCALACPLGIDTGAFVKEVRARGHDDGAEKTALRAAKHWASVEHAARGALRSAAVAKRIGAGPLLRAGTGAARKLAGEELVPAWSSAIPTAAPARMPATEREGAAAVYLPSCTNRIFGRDGGGPSLPEALVELSARAGHPLWIPEDVAGSCCGQPWISKGFRAGAELKSREIVERLWAWSDAGALPVVVDATSCSAALIGDLGPYLDEASAALHAKLRILDSIAWAHDVLLERLDVGERLASVAVHPPCASRHLGLDRKLATLAWEIADEVVVPARATCCGMAGDRGLLHPELAANATAEQASELAGREFDARLCSNRTCEIGLNEHVGGGYESFVFALEAATR